jgi:hypothetical protein
MQSLIKEEGSPVSAGKATNLTTSPIHGSFPDKKNSPFCWEFCIAASCQNPRNVPANVFSDKNGFLWRCIRPECQDAVWNLGRDYIIGCRRLNSAYANSQEIRKDLDRLRKLSLAKEWA